MNKKYQVFISSTYNDLIKERQAAVEAILSAGDIPAGMELFSAGNESQLKVIQHWIDESDIFMLILGGRYGSIEEKTGKSYIQLEYEHALSRGMPIFAVVISDRALKKRKKLYGPDVVETDNYERYKEFRALVLQKICELFEDEKDIEIAIHKALASIKKRHKSLAGWVSGNDIALVETRYQNELERFFNTLTFIGNISAQLADITPCTKEEGFDATRFPSDIDKVHELLRSLVLELISKAGHGMRRFCVYQPTGEEPDTRLVMNYAYGFKRAGQAGFSLKPGEGIAGQCFLSKEAVLVPDVEEDENFICNPGAERRIKSLLCAPILVNNEAVAVINIDSTAKNAFRKLDLELVQILANIWALVYEISGCFCISTGEIIDTQ